MSSFGTVSLMKVSLSLRMCQISLSPKRSRFVWAVSVSWTSIITSSISSKLFLKILKVVFTKWSLISVLSSDGFKNWKYLNDSSSPESLFLSGDKIYPPVMMWFSSITDFNRSSTGIFFWLFCEKIFAPILYILASV